MTERRLPRCALVVATCRSKKAANETSASWRSRLGTGLALVAILVMSHPAPVPPAPLAKVQQAEPLRPDQVETALQDMEMLREFNGLVRPDPADSKM